MSSIISWAAVSVIAASGAGTKLADAKFASELCKGWNESGLPKAVGLESQGGSDWIVDVVADGAEPGYQKIVSGRDDCEDWPLFELVIEKQDDGRAICTSGGAYDGKNMTWKFMPETEDWFGFGESFGLGAFYTLWANGMEGSRSIAWYNRSAFGDFFKVAARLALQSDWKTGCSGLDVEDVEDAIEDLKEEWEM